MTNFPDRGEQFLERPLPASEESERAILGGILLNNILAPGVIGQLEPIDFYGPLHRRIFSAMVVLNRQGKTIDPIMIGEELKRESSVESIGGVATITNLTYGLPHFTDLKDYIKVVKEKSMARAMIRLNNDTTSALLEEDEEVETVLATHVSAHLALQARTEAGQAVTLKKAVQETREIFTSWTEGNLDVSGLRTGIPKLDAKLKMRGLAKGEMTLIGARPSTGKTALLIQIATHVMRLGHPVLFVSLEMLRTRIVMRMLPPLTGIANKSINPHTLKNLPDQAAKLHEALNSIENLPMYFESAAEHHKLIAIAEHLIRTRGIRLVVFDYLQLFRNVQVNRGATKEEAVGRIITDLKSLAIRTDTASLGAIQFSRESEKEYRRPRGTDARDSGQIEQAADVLLFPWDRYAKEHAANPDEIKDMIDLDIYCEKQRDGERYWTVKVEYNKNLQTFIELPDAEEIAAINRGRDWHQEQDK